ncbi:MAG TPA: aminotransferase class I/II-fold pyridoxal phosphate-dependent enzyme, partial [Thermoanaerobaculia bacterium]|nr:aminotransferase class I/II-fold pyridoxal phosphate-dependent enzyme [Thermoanaerobaculia bacterium]
MATTVKWLPYGRQDVHEDDIAAVVEVLRSDWLTTGPAVPAFEKAVAETVGAAEAVAVSSGTAALHAAYAALGLGPGDEVIVPAITFAATSNAALYLGATPVFADVDAKTLLLDPADTERKITPRTRAIVAVDYAGQPCDYDALRALARSHGLLLVADACHSLGAAFRGRPVGALADLTAFSFHPVKTITTGEGGMVTTDDPDRARWMRAFRNHGITTDHRERAESGTVSYDMVLLGYNYRLTDFQAALGMAQLRRLSSVLEQRRRLADIYYRGLSDLAYVRPLLTAADRTHAHHILVVRLETGRLRQSRDEVV